MKPSAPPLPPSSGARAVEGDVGGVVEGGPGRVREFSGGAGGSGQGG